MNPLAFQADFAAKLRAPVPHDRSRRLDVHRNNVFVGLVEALKDRFPAVQAAVGAAFFAALARDYAAADFPSSPVMMFYGESFADFIAASPQLADYPWLADVARLECAMTHCFHAADATPIGPGAFAQLLPGQLDTLRLHLHPSVRLVPSMHPVVTLWHITTGQTAPCDVASLAAETALVHRCAFDVVVRSLSVGGGAFFGALCAGHPLGDSHDRAIAQDPDFDLATHLELLIGQGLSIGWHPSETPG